MQIAFIGLGNMGLPMALNLVRKGHPVRGYDLSENALKALKDAGGATATSARDAVNPCPGVNSTAPSSRNYTGGFSVDLMLKDLGLAVDASTQSGATAALGALARNIFSMQSSLGNGAKDFGSVFSLLGARAA